MGAEARVKELGLQIPEAPPALAAYVPWVRTGNLAFIAGQVPVVGGQVRFAGRVGADVTTETAQEAARVTALNLLAQMRAAAGGSLDNVRRVVRLEVFVNCTDTYTTPHLVANAASELMVQVFGDAGRHARAALGANALPMGVPVEITAVVEVA